MANFFQKETKLMIRDAIITVASAFLIGVAVNLVRPDSLPFVADEPYEILVPCPEPGGEVTAMASTDERLKLSSTFVVDARLKTDFDKWHIEGAFNLTYDYLDPTPKEDIQALAKAIAKSRANLVAVYGDGDTPDTGEQLGKEISFHGIKNVFFVSGGAPKLQSVKGGQP